MTPTKTALAESLAAVVAKRESPASPGPYARLGRNNQLLNLDAINADARYDDPRADAYGPHLFAEVDPQAYQVYLSLSELGSSDWTYAEPDLANRLTVTRANGFAAKSWSDADYAEMAAAPAPPPPPMPAWVPDGLHAKGYGSRASDDWLVKDPRPYKGSRAPAEMYAAVSDPDPFAALPRGTRRVPEEAELVCYYDTPEGEMSGEPCKHAEFLGCDDCPNRNAPPRIVVHCASCEMPEGWCECSPLSCAACGAGAFFCECPDGLPEIVPPPVAEVFPDLTPAFWRDDLLSDAVRQADERLGSIGERLAAAERETDALIAETDALAAEWQAEEALAASYETDIPEHHTPLPMDRHGEAAWPRAQLQQALEQGGLPPSWEDQAADALMCYRLDEEWVDLAEGILQTLEDMDGYHAWESHHDPDRPEDDGEEEAELAQHWLESLGDALEQNGEEGWEDEAYALAELYEPTAEWAAMAEELLARWKPDGPPVGSPDELPGFPNFADTVSDNDGYAAPPDDERERFAVSNEPTPPAPPPPTGGDGEPEAPSPSDPVPEWSFLRPPPEQRRDTVDDEAAIRSAVVTTRWDKERKERVPSLAASWGPAKREDDFGQACYYAWRLAHYHAGRDTSMPVTAESIALHWSDDRIRRLDRLAMALAAEFYGVNTAGVTDPLDRLMGLAPSLVPVPGEPPARGGEAEERDNAPRQPTYRSVDAEQREETVKQTGIKVRVQLTSYFAGDFLKGNNDNYMVRGLAGLRPAEQVRDALQPLADLAVERFGRKRGGKRLRIQITEQSAKGSAYLKQDGEAAASYNLGILGITAEEGSPLVDYLLAAAFGERRRDATELAVAWRRFESLPPLATEGGSSKPEGGSPEGEAPTATSGRAENGSNAVQPSSGEPKTGVGPGPYTFDADGCAPCHLPSLVGRLDGEVDPQKDLDFAWALDFVNEPDFSCNGEKDHMLRLARQWKARFPDHEVVVREGGCQDSPYAPDADQLGKVVALVGVAVSDAAPAQAGDLANPKTAPATETQIPENTVQPSGVPEGYDPDRDAVESMVESLRALGHGKLADLLINAGGTPKRELYRQAYDLVAGGEVVR